MDYKGILDINLNASSAGIFEMSFIHEAAST